MLYAMFAARVDRGRDRHDLYWIPATFLFNVQKGVSSATGIQEMPGFNCPRSRGRIDVRIDKIQELRFAVPRYADSCGSENGTLGFLVCD